MDKEAILKALRAIEHHHGVEILYACESGSRAWGFASPDSDYDVRFLYRQPLDRYLGVSQVEESLDLFDGDFDGVGWDVAKAARLLEKSNASLIEWLHSPIVYRSQPGFLERWQTVAGDFSPRALAHHYIGLAKTVVKSKFDDELRRPKDYLYGLRAVLGARWIVKNGTRPPVPFEDVLDAAPQDLLGAIEHLLKLKESTDESHRVEPIAELEEFVTGSIEKLREQANELPTERPSRTALDELVQRELVPSRRGVELRERDLTVKRVRQPDLLLFDAVVGSHAYGTTVESSDIDRGGIFVMPQGFCLGLYDIQQTSDDRHDQVYYEVGRFVDLALKSNPNILELLAIPDDCVEYRHPLFSLLTLDLFLSKECARTFGQYAMGQIRKARGLNKKIVNPQPEERKGVLEFCYILEGQGSTPLLEWLDKQGLKAQECGLTGVPHGKNVFALYGGDGGYRGLVSEKDRDALVCSSVPREARPLAWMVFQQDAFRVHCKAHREYWEWVEERNEDRYAVNVEHGRGYDSKNLMHTYRLLQMALEIAEEGELRVRRPNRDHLLRIRAGEFSYDELLAGAEKLLLEVEEAFANADLPDEPDETKANEVLVEIRSRW